MILSRSGPTKMPECRSPDVRDGEALQPGRKIHHGNIERAHAQVILRQQSMHAEAGGHDRSRAAAGDIEKAAARNAPGIERFLHGGTTAPPPTYDDRDQEHRRQARQQINGPHHLDGHRQVEIAADERLLFGRHRTSKDEQDRHGHRPKRHGDGKPARPAGAPLQQPDLQRGVDEVGGDEIARDDVNPMRHRNPFCLDHPPNAIGRS